MPAADSGGPNKFAPIAGRVSGARPGQRLVLFAKSNQWWVQPTAQQPYTDIAADTSWKNSIHLGLEYAALLVEPGYTPPTTLDELPNVGGTVIARARVPGTPPAAGQPPLTLTPKAISFSGYEWEVRQLPSGRGGTQSNFNPANVWTDAQGFLHLRIAKTATAGAQDFTCAEVSLRRSLGYGSYVFVVREVAQLEPAAVLGLYTWDDLDAAQHHREMGIEISRWGDTLSKNSQYAIQPYYVPVNMFRFNSPAGALTYAFQWEPGQVAFSTKPGRGLAENDLPNARHVFTSGVPTPGNETLHLSFYVYGKTRLPLQKEAEVVIEKFEYLP